MPIGIGLGALAGAEGLISGATAKKARGSRKKGLRGADLSGIPEFAPITQGLEPLDFQGGMGDAMQQPGLISSLLEELKRKRMVR